MSSVEKTPGVQAHRVGFWTSASLEKLASDQGIGAVADLAELRGDFWPAQEGVNEFIDEIHRLRQQGEARELP